MLTDLTGLWLTFDMFPRVAGRLTIVPEQVKANRDPQEQVLGDLRDPGTTADGDVASGGTLRCVRDGRATEDGTSI